MTTTAMGSKDMAISQPSNTLGDYKLTMAFIDTQ